MLEFMTISLIITLAVMSPGPDFAIVSRNALRYSQKTGLFTAMGIACGSLFHASYCILGFAIVISKSILLFNIIKYIGASYLIYIGIKGLLEKKTSSNIEAQKSNAEISAFQKRVNKMLLFQQTLPRCDLRMPRRKSRGPHAI